MAESGAAISIIELVVLSGRVLSRCYEYIGKIKDAPRDIQRIISEIAVLKALLDQLEILASSAGEGQLKNLTALEIPGGPFQSCSTALSELETKITTMTKASSLRRGALWPIEGPKLEQTLARLENHKSTFIMALTSDSLAVNVETNNKVENVSSRLDEIKLANDRDKILQWLKSPDPTTNHHAARKKHEKGTGDWLLESGEFKEWLYGNGSILWLNGIPGAGKTILSSTVIEHLINETKNRRACRVVYYYFDFSDHQKQTADNCFRSLTRQLCEQSNAIPEELSVLHTDLQGASPALNHLVPRLASMLADDVIVIDALDECNEDLDDKERSLFFEKLREIEVLNGKHCKVFITSRPEPDIKSGMSGLNAVLLRAKQEEVDVDILTHIKGSLEKDKRLSKWPPKVKEEIERELMKGAQGMFRWVVCQLDSLRTRLRLADMRKELKNLPRNLEETYARIFKNIPPGYEKEIRTILMLLAFSTRPMTIPEVAEAAAVNLTEQAFSVNSRFFDPLDILELCSSLVSETEIKYVRESHFSSESREFDSKGIQFSHYSVKEYILSENSKKVIPPDYHITASLSHRSITEICLIYLLDFDGEEEVLVFDHKEKELVFDHEKFPLLSYAALKWTTHLELVIEFDRVQINLLLLRLFDPKDIDKLMNYLSLYDPIFYRELSLHTRSTDEFLGFSKRKRNKQDFETPLYYACYYGLLPVVDALMGEAGSDSKSIEELGSALSAAASKGHVSIMRRLLERGADPNSPWGGRFHRPLQAAASSGNFNAVELLLNTGADVTACGGRLGTALHAAAKKGNPKIVQALIDRGHEIDININQEGTPLTLAVRSKNSKAVSILVQSGADPNSVDRIRGSPLYLACQYASIDVVKTLLDSGAEVNQSRSRKKLPAHAAAWRGHLGILKLLIESGCDINARDSLCNTALCSAIDSWDDEVLQFMLDNGADINLCGYWGKFPVDHAIYVGNLTAADKLLELGAQFGDRALGKALIMHEREYLVKKLLDRGADPNGEDESYGNMLQLAIYHRRPLQKILLLVKTGADVNAIEGKYGTALQAAIDRDMDDIVIFLLQNGASLNHSPCGEHGSALQAAIVKKNHPIIKLLIDAGADVNAGGGKYGSPLQAAVQSEQESTVQLLLIKGVEVNAEGGAYGTSLRAALAIGNESIAKLLIAAGADLNSSVIAEHSAAGNRLRTSIFRSSVEVAVASGNINMVQMVLDSGANLDDKNICAAALVQSIFCSESAGISVLEYLITKGADVENCGGNALFHAVEMRNIEMVTILLQHKASTNQEFASNGSALQASIRNYDLDIFHLLLDAGADINAYGGYCGSALGDAIKKGIRQVFTELLARGADINLKAGKLGTPLMIAIGQGDEEMVRELLNHGADIHECYGDYGNALQTAISRGYYNLACELLDNGADPRIPGCDATALITASGSARPGQLELMRRLISFGCNADAETPFQGDPFASGAVVSSFALHHAVFYENGAAASLLLENGVDINVQCGQNGTALQLACLMASFGMVKLLLAEGADVNAPAGPRGTALQVAVIQGSETFVELLLQYGADVNLEGGKYGSAIEAAASCGNVTYVKLFLDHGAEVNINCGLYGNPLQAAAKRGDWRITRLLLDHGADVHLSGGHYGYALQAAACTYSCGPECIENMKLLLAAGADVNAVGGEYGSALEAAAYHHKDYVELLLQHGADPHFKGGKYGSPLGAAEEKKLNRVVKLLLQYSVEERKIEQAENISS